MYIKQSKRGRNRDKTKGPDKNLEHSKQDSIILTNKLKASAQDGFALPQKLASFLFYLVSTNIVCW